MNVVPNNIPLFIYKQNAQFYQNTSDKDMKISISILQLIIILIINYLLNIYYIKIYLLKYLIMKNK